MQYEKDVLVSSNTSESDAVETLLNLAPGVITKFEIEYPDGCAGLVFSEVWRWDNKLWPSNEEVAFSGDDVVISFNPQYDLSKSPYTLTIKTWNLDDTFQHTPIYRIELTKPGQSISDLLKKLIFG